ncbi:MAG TPA: multicopper oxidase domain-containing protein [Longimicrobiales bacterium]|nr:multicopper oxidase domain-containing protein [Longimicrobiales bacterium]
MKLRTGWPIVMVLTIQLLVVFSSAPSTEVATRPAPATPAIEVARFHDNENPAGVVEDGVLRIAMRAVEAAWHPYGEDENGATLPAFAEEGEKPTIPGPYLRAELGQTVDVTIENTFDSLLVVYGFGERRSAPLEPWLIEPGERATRRFVADAEGTFYYFAKVGEYVEDPFEAMGEARLRSVFLSGALVVQGPELPEPIDDIVLLGVYVHEMGPAILTMNGRPWPYTKRLQYEMGDTVRWRILNTSVRTHPMHLHGFYYEVEAMGDLDETEIYWETQRPREVTVDMERGETMAISWVAERPGNWVFHCHISGHVGPNHYPLGEPASQEEVLREQILGDPHHDPDNHVVEGMGGLMMALNIRPSPDWRPDERDRRQMRLVVQSDSVPAPPGAPLEQSGPHRRVFSPIYQEPGTEIALDSVQVPGSPLILREGEPTSIWVVNRLQEPTQIHWHGLEIEAPFDGVVGVGGYNGMPTPAIMPGDSFEVRYTPPQPGSFMYHTHMSDIRQQGGGLYGPLVVIPEGEEWDPTHDKIMLVGFHPGTPGPHLNGRQGDLDPMELVAGEPYRFRFMNITLGATVTFRLTRGADPGGTIRWEMAAKDGSELPPHRRTRARAEMRVAVGETYDVIVDLPTPGGRFAPAEYSLEMWGDGLLAKVPIRVKAPGG